MECTACSSTAPLAAALCWLLLLGGSIMVLLSRPASSLPADLSMLRGVGEDGSAAGDMDGPALEADDESGPDSSPPWPTSDAAISEGGRAEGQVRAVWRGA